jgi:hypothetical protein
MRSRKPTWTARSTMVETGWKAAVRIWKQEKARATARIARGQAPGGPVSAGSCSAIGCDLLSGPSQPPARRRGPLSPSGAYLSTPASR